MPKVLTLGLMICAIGFAVHTATADSWNYSCPGCAQSHAMSGWQGYAQSSQPYAGQGYSNWNSGQSQYPSYGGSYGGYMGNYNRGYYGGQSYGYQSYGQPSYGYNSPYRGYSPYYN